MPCDKERPSTWIRFRQELCETCVANCCRMPVEVRVDDLVALGYVDASEALDTEPRLIAKRLQREGVVRSFRQSTQLFLLERQSSGACLFLDAESRCTVYEKRPKVCRSFPVEMGNRLDHCPYEKKN